MMPPLARLATLFLIGFVGGVNIGETFFNPFPGYRIGSFAIVCLCVMAWFTVYFRW